MSGQNSPHLGSLMASSACKDLCSQSRYFSPACKGPGHEKSTQTPLKVGAARGASQQDAHCPPAPTPTASGSAACVYISPSIWRLQIEIISSWLCQPVLSLTPAPESPRQPQLGSDKDSSVPWVSDGWERKGSLAPCCSRAFS